MENNDLFVLCSWELHKLMVVGGGCVEREGGREGGGTAVLWETTLSSSQLSEDRCSSLQAGKACGQSQNNIFKCLKQSTQGYRGNGSF